MIEESPLYKFPLGARGERPIFFPVQLPFERIRELTQIPGVARTGGGLRCTPDVAHELAAILGVPPPRVLLEDHMTDDELRAEMLALPGLARYRELGLDKKLRDYQKFGAFFMARRAYAMNCDPMRAGKTLTSIAASVLTGARRTLVVCPSIAKYVWAEQVARWVGEEALILEGRGGDEARRYCKVCDARGRSPDALTGELIVCDACKLRNGQAAGYKLFVTYAWSWGASGKLENACPKHPAVFDPATSRPDTTCPACIEDIHGAIDAAKFVVVNYDLLVGQKEADAAGALHVRDDLPGWVTALSKHRFDLCIGDELHLVRGFSTASTKKGQTRRERFCEATEHIPQVWGLTGTPIFGFVRDLWGQLDAISKGALTGNGTNERLPFVFGSRYCNAAKDAYGWKWDGRSHFAETELKERLRYVKLQRPRSQILAEMPAKNRQVFRIDPVDKKAIKSRKPRGSDDKTKLTYLLSQTLDSKLDALTENILSELSEGGRCIVFVLLRKSAETVGKAIDSALKRADVKTRMREVDAKVWAVHGDTSPETRFAMARAFREHTGGGVFVATIDSVQVAVSLKGAQSVHFADLHWQPAAMLQAEDRPYELGITGLSICYYSVRGTIDEHMEATVLPKVIALSRVVEEQGADELKKTFSAGDDTKTLKEIIDDCMKYVDTSLEAFDDDD